MENIAGGKEVDVDGGKHQDTLPLNLFNQNKKKKKTHPFVGTTHNLQVNHF